MYTFLWLLCCDGEIFLAVGCCQVLKAVFSVIVQPMNPDH